MNTKIMSRDLMKLICNIVDCQDENNLCITDLQKIDKISLNKYNLAHVKTDMEISDLSFLRNLKTLVISNFIINDDDIEVINTLSNLQSIQFTKCIFNLSRAKIELSIDNIIFESCLNANYNSVSYTKNLRIFGDKCLNINNLVHFNNLEKAYFQHCNIINADSLLNFPNLNYLNLEKSSTNNSKIVEQLSNKITVEYRRDKN